MRNEVDVRRMNPSALAYIGDAIYEVYVRNFVLQKESNNMDKQNKIAVKYVRAEGQAYAIKIMFEDLEEKEQALVKRARNKKTTSKPQNADPVTYKWATAFEALIGYFYLAGKFDRMEDIIEKTLNIISEADINHVRKKESKATKKDNK